MSAMNGSLFVNSLLLGASALLCASALGKDQKSVPDHSLSEFTLGSHVSGDPVDLSKLQGKAVVIEYWGTH